LPEALGKDIHTDCSINAQLEGKTYCFGSKEAIAEPQGQSREGADLLLIEASRLA
jgi:hypothetical protein